MPASTSACQHLDPTGHRCGSPALRGEQFCFYHHPTRSRRPAAGRKPRRPAFHLHGLADQASIQRALARVVSRVVSGRLDRPTASLIVYTCQLANQTLLGDTRRLGNLIQQVQIELNLGSVDALAALLATIRPPRPAHKKCTESEPNHCRNIT